jgi:AcrR family transcriptional regulator
VTPSHPRVGKSTSKTHGVLLDATEALMLEQGYAAVSSRRVAARAGTKAPLVHYYFPTLDDLFVAVLRRRADYLLEHLAAALESDRPLHALWEFNTDPTWTSLMVEFMALANQRKAIGAENARVGEKMRQLQADALPGVLERYGIDTDLLPPLALAVLMTSIGRNVVLERAGGVLLGHDETMALVEHWLDAVERVTTESQADLGPSSGETPPRTMRTAPRRGRKSSRPRARTGK